MLWHGRPLTVVHETSGLLFVNKPAGLGFHADAAQNDPGVLPLLRSMCLEGEIAHDGRLYSVHRLDRVTSGLLMVAKTAEAAAAAGELLRERQLHKYYVALSSRKPSKKMGRVAGDMERSRRGSWKLLRSMERPAITTFTSVALGASGASSSAPPLRCFLLKPLTGRTHQLRVALKAVGSPILGDPLYAAAHQARTESRAYLHAAAIRIPPGQCALSEDGRPIDAVCVPQEGAEFRTVAFERAWQQWFPEARDGGGWFPGTAVASPDWIVGD